MVYDITRRDTFAAVQEWIDDARRNTRDNVVIVVVGNKRDRDDKCVQQGTCHGSPRSRHFFARHACITPIDVLSPCFQESQRMAC